MAELATPVTRTRSGPQTNGGYPASPVPRRTYRAPAHVIEKARPRLVVLAPAPTSYSSGSRGASPSNAYSCSPTSGQQPLNTNGENAAEGGAVVSPPPTQRRSHPNSHHSSQVLHSPTSMAQLDRGWGRERTVAGGASLNVSSVHSRSHSCDDDKSNGSGSGTAADLNSRATSNVTTPAVPPDQRWSPVLAAEDAGYRDVPPPSRPCRLTPFKLPTATPLEPVPEMPMTTGEAEPQGGMPDEDSDYGSSSSSDGDDGTNTQTAPGSAGRSRYSMSGTTDPSPLGGSLAAFTASPRQLLSDSTCVPLDNGGRALLTHIAVYIRVRPKRSGRQRGIEVLDAKGIIRCPNGVTVTDSSSPVSRRSMPTPGGALPSNRRESSAMTTARVPNREFRFDCVLPESATQLDVMRAVGHTVLGKVMSGYNGTILCYGQSGCGKTHTMLGPNGAARLARCMHNLGDVAGLTPRIIHELFQRLRRRYPISTGKPLGRSSDSEDGDGGTIGGDQDGGSDMVDGSGSDESANGSFTVSISVVEMYKEKLTDLLSGFSAANVVSVAQPSRGVTAARFGGNVTNASDGDDDDGTAESDEEDGEVDDDADRACTAATSRKPSIALSCGAASDRHGAEPGMTVNVANNVGSAQSVSPPQALRGNSGSLDPSLQPQVSPADPPFSNIRRQRQRVRPKGSNEGRSASKLKTVEALAMKSTQASLVLREELRADGTRRVFVDGLSRHVVADETAALAAVAHAAQARHVASTMLNQTSSRAHTLFFVYVTQRAKAITHGQCHSPVAPAEGDESDTEQNTLDDAFFRDLQSAGGGTMDSVLTLVDLAGSERVSATQAEGQRLEEAKRINLSLTLLCNVIRKLAEGHTRHIPYRDAKLTRLLQESLGGNAFTTLLCNVSPDDVDVGETVSTLRFASSAKNLFNRPIINRILSIEELQQQLRAAQRHIAVRDQQIADLERRLAAAHRSKAASSPAEVPPAEKVVDRCTATSTSPAPDDSRWVAEFGRNVGAVSAAPMDPPAGPVMVAIGTQTDAPIAAPLKSESDDEETRAASGVSSSSTTSAAPPEETPLPLRSAESTDGALETLQGEDVVASLAQEMLDVCRQLHEAREELIATQEMVGRERVTQEELERRVTGLWRLVQEVGAERACPPPPSLAPLQTWEPAVVSAELPAPEPVLWPERGGSSVSSRPSSGLSKEAPSNGASNSKNSSVSSISSISSSSSSSSSSSVCSRSFSSRSSSGSCRHFSSATESLSSLTRLTRSSATADSALLPRGGPWPSYKMTPPRMDGSRSNLFNGLTTPAVSNCESIAATQVPSRSSRPPQKDTVTSSTGPAESAPYGLMLFGAAVVGGVVSLSLARRMYRRR